MLFYVNIIIILKKKLLTRNRFRNFFNIENTDLHYIFTKWNVNLLLTPNQIYSYYLTNYT